MPRISTDNYDIVASWNGSQDLFVVEQPDGTKVATPAMVKQFIEAGDFEATGEVKDGHGNILNDMAKSVDVDEVIGDLSQTGLTGDSVAEQLGALKTGALKVGVITSASVTVNAGWHQFVDIRLTEALPTGTVALFVTKTASPAGIFANYYDYDSSTLKIRIGVYNTMNEAVTGTYEVAYLYTE